MRLSLSLTARLTLLFAAASSAVLLLLGLLIGQSVEHHFMRLDDETLRDALQGTQRVLARVRSESEAHALPRLMEGVLLGHNEVGVAVFAADGGRLFSAGNLVFPAQLQRLAEHSDTAVEQVWQTAGRRYRAQALRYASGVVAWPPVVIAVGIDISVHDDFMRNFRLSLWAFVLCAAGLIGLFGWVAVRRGLAPLFAIRRATADITADRLGQRLDARNVPAELAGLVTSLNDMLARLEASFQRLSDFSSDLAHELRTPLTNLMTQTQVTLSKPRSVEEYREVLYANAEEFERQARMIGDMLFLAKAEHDLIVPRRERVDLRAEVDTLCDFYGMLAEEKQVSLSVSGEGTVSGDRDMLRRAIANLLSNAIRHAATDSTVALRIDHETGATLAVENRGETIPPAQLARVFDRFFRADDARRRDEGVGLGLAIARSIMAAHRGDIDASSADGLTRFVLRFPADEA